MQKQRSDLYVVIASKGRSLILTQTLESLSRQSELPNCVLISITECCDRPKYLPENLNIKIITGEKGATKQINRALKAVPSEISFICLIDDDVELHKDYLKEGVKALEANMEFSILNGECIRNQDISRDDSIIALRNLTPTDRKISPIFDVWGCNILMRRTVVDYEVMDERLPLYGWLWDADWGQRARKAGFKCGKSGAMMFTHLYVPSARIPGTGIGFSQIMNPTYYYQKGVIVSGIWDLIVNNWLKCLMINIFFWLRQDKRVDRLGRIKGNFFALYFILRGRIEPELLEDIVSSKK